MVQPANQSLARFLSIIDASSELSPQQKQLLTRTAEELSHNYAQLKSKLAQPSQDAVASVQAFNATLRILEQQVADTRMTTGMTIYQYWKTFRNTLLVALAHAAIGAAILTLGAWSLGTAGSAIIAYTIVGALFGSVLGCQPVLMVGRRTLTATKNRFFDCSCDPIVQAAREFRTSFGPM